MRARGIPQLVLLGQGSELREHLAAEALPRCTKPFPDVNNWLLRMATFLQAPDLGSLQAAMRHDGPAELLSMWLCLYTTEWDLQAGLDLESEEDVRQWAEQVRQFTEQHGQPPHPAVLFSRTAAEGP